METFYDIINHADATMKFRTTDDLFKLIDYLTQLPPEEKKLYDVQINDIIFKIPEGLRILSVQQRKLFTYSLQNDFRSDFIMFLYKILHKLNHNEMYNSETNKPVVQPKVKSYYEALVDETQKKIKEASKPKDPIEILTNELNYYNPTTNSFENLLELDYYPDIKNTPSTLTANDYDVGNYKAIKEMLTAIIELVKNIRKNTMSSQVSEFILTFEDIAKVILSEHPDQITVYTIVCDCLKDNGWTSSGFYSPPDKTKLIKIAKGLQEILEMVS